MTDFFPLAFRYVVLRDEQGFVNDPADSGGATKYGVTLSTLAQWRKCPVSPADVEALTVEETSAIYRALYWQPIGCDNLIKISVATAMLDASVLFGPGRAVAAAQDALLTLGRTSIKVDGYPGPVTTTALNFIDPDKFLDAFVSKLVQRILKLVLINPVDIKFRNGWLNRVNRYRTFRRDFQYAK